MYKESLLKRKNKTYLNLPSTEIPKVSVIIPVYGQEKSIRDCIESVLNTNYPNLETIVVSDNSPDRSAEIATELGVKTIVLPEQKGAAYCRNIGAEYAQGEILIFIDSDVVIQADVIDRIVEHLGAEEYSAVFGMYTSHVPHKDVYSRFKNLQHHFVHLSNTGEICSFWTGCGGVKKAAFKEINGFDETINYMEDINLGFRLHKAGGKILLTSAIRCTHLKKYTFRSLLRSDILGRAKPWSKLFFNKKASMNNLNTKVKEKVTLVFFGLAVLFLLASTLSNVFLPIVFALLAGIVLLQRTFILYTNKIYGWRFGMTSILLLFMYYFSCISGILLGVSEIIWERINELFGAKN